MQILFHIMQLCSLSKISPNTFNRLSMYIELLFLYNMGGDYDNLVDSKEHRENIIL